MSKPPNRLGRGLSSLISTGAHDSTVSGLKTSPPGSPPQSGPVPAQSTHPSLRAIPIDAIHANPHQPRRTFDEASLIALSDSIRMRGALQPILIRHGPGGYELIAGERRLRAARLAGLTEIPAVIRPVADDQMLELALVENVQRSNLNPIEKARGYQLLSDRHGLSHEEIGARMGEDRATVTNTIRLLELDEGVQALVAAGDLGAGHGKALLGITDKRLQLEWAGRAAREGWTVRALETAVRGRQPGGGGGAAARPRRAVVQSLEEALAAALGTRVVIREGRKRHTGSIQIEYYSLNDFERIVARLGVGADALE